MTRQEIEAVVARERPGWRVVEVIELNDESGPSLSVEVERGESCSTLLLSEDGRIAGEEGPRPRRDPRA
jgi:hypothetical protein